MPNIRTLPLGAYQTNCYIVWQEGSSRCLVIDPGYEPERVLSQIQTLGLTLDTIALTHGHFDHVGGVKLLAAETGCRVFLAEGDLSLPPMFTAGPLYYTDLYRDTLEAAGLSFRVIPTPGHTPGSVCLLGDGVLFSGDTLFAGSCGRTDLPGGNWAEILPSLAKLAALPGDFPVYPGHGEATTLARERAYNPYLKG